MENTDEHIFTFYVINRSNNWLRLHGYPPQRWLYLNRWFRRFK